MKLFGKGEDRHVLVVTSGAVLLVSRDVDVRTFFDWEVLVVDSVTRSDFWSLGVKCNSKRTTLLLLLCSTSMVDD